MSGLATRPYRPEDEGEWDRLVDTSRNGTLLHRRAFLEVAPRGLQDRSLVVEQGGRMVGVFPCAVHPSDPTMLDSHPATSFGGVVHDGRLGGPVMLEVLDELAEHAFHDGFDTLRYKAVPAAYQVVPAQDDLYALFRRGARRARVELASVLGTGGPREVARHRRRHLRRALRAGVEVVDDTAYLEAFWPVLVDRLATRHGAEPQHSLADVQRLSRAFPGRVGCVVARERGSVVAGAVVFRTGQVDHAQYLAADDQGYRSSALDLVIEHLVAAARGRGVRFVSLGTTTLSGGRTLIEGLYRYKSEFGAGSIVHETYDLPLR